MVTVHKVVRRAQSEACLCFGQDHPRHRLAYTRQAPQRLGEARKGGCTTVMHHAPLRMRGHVPGYRKGIERQESYPELTDTAAGVRDRLPITSQTESLV